MSIVSRGIVSRGIISRGLVSREMIAAIRGEAPDPVAPTIAASDSYDAETRILTIRIDSVTGTPSPSRALTALEIDGVDVLGDQTGSGPWSYGVPDSASAQTVAWTVTAQNSVNSATVSGSEVAAANLSAPAQMSAPALAGGTQQVDLDLAAAPADGGSAITRYEYQVDNAAGDFNSPVATGTVTPADRGKTIKLTPLTFGSYKARSRATNAVGNGAWSEASGDATVLASPSGDTTAPTFDPGSYDAETRTLTIQNLSEGGTLVWATSDTGVTPSYSAADGWEGPIYESGSVSVEPDVEVSISVSDATPNGSRRLTFCIQDAGGNLSTLDSDTIPVENVVPVSGITYVGGATFQLENPTTLTPLSLTSLTGGVGSAPAAGDLILVTTGVSSVTVRGSVVKDASDVDYATLEAGFSNATYDATCRAFWKIAGPGDTSIKVAPSTATDPNTIHVQVLRGVDAATPFDVATPADAIGSQDDPNPPAITPVTDGAVIYVIGHYASTDTDGPAVELSETYLSNVLSSAHQFASPSRITGMRTGTVAWTGGTYDPPAMTCPLNVAGSTWVGITAAMRPA